MYNIKKLSEETDNITFQLVAGYPGHERYYTFSEQSYIGDLLHFDISTIQYHTTYSGQFNINKQLNETDLSVCGLFCAPVIR